MLIQFTIQNFLSFRDEVTFSMVAVNSDNQHSDHLAQNEAGEGRSVLPIAAMYGANAAGKSNLIKAISFVQNLIVKGTRIGQTIAVSTFKLGNYSSQPSKFEIIFTYAGSQYSYGFKLNKEQILEEWLYGIPKDRKREVMYFERITSDKRETTVKYGVKLKDKSTNQQRLEFITEGTRFNQLFLTEAVDRNVHALVPVANWFRESLTIIPAEVDAMGLELSLHSDESLTFIDFLSKFLQFADTGIDSISTKKIKLDFDRYFPHIPKAMREEILQKFESADKNSMTIIENSQGGRVIVSNNNVTELKFNHRNENGEPIGFSIEEESDGTQRLINLIPFLFLLKQRSEQVVFLDELDRRFHPQLSRCFVEMEIGCRNKSNQLVFTTHDTNLLDLDLLRRDEIWFIEKNQQGSSSCYSLAEFKIRPDLKVEKGYLNGRFGAIPFFGNPKELGWFECKDAPSGKVNS